MILEFGFSIERQENKPMNGFLSKSFSDNRKSKIQKRPRGPKWLGLFAIAFVLVVCGATAESQQSKKVPRIGYLSSLDPAGESTRAEAIRLALRERGYIEGQSIA